MLKDNLQNGIVVKSNDGDYKLFVNGKLKNLPTHRVSLEGDRVVDQVAKSQAENGAGLNRKNEAELSTQLEESEVAANKASKGANFYFDVEDEDELRQHQKGADVGFNVQFRSFTQNKAQQVIQDYFSDSGLVANQQLNSIVLSRLKGVRSKAQAREALKLFFEKQNSDISSEELDNFLTKIEEAKKEIEHIAAAGKLPQGQGRAQERATLKSDERVMDNQAKQDSIDRQDNRMEYKKEPEVADNTQMSQHVTTGSVDELRNLTLKEFRRLGDSPQASAEKIMEKINLLEDQSLVKKSEGIAAWRQSGVYKVYVEIGGRSMAEKKPVEQVIRELKESNQPFLAPQEFNVVSDLNSKLSY